MSSREKPKFAFGDVNLDEEVVMVNGQRFTEADSEAVADELAGGSAPARLSPGD